MEPPDLGGPSYIREGKELPSQIFRKERRELGIRNSFCALRLRVKRGSSI